MRTRSENASFAPFYTTKNVHFTKTGSGRTQGKLKLERDALSQVEPHLALELTERLIRLALESTPEDDEAAEEFELDENGACR